MKSQIKINYSDRLPDSMHLSHEEFEKEAKLAMAVKLFEMRKISSGIAASLAGIDRVKFLLSLSDYNVNMIEYREDELDNDLLNA
jgi:predicted HTH domain antitoxin